MSISGLNMPLEIVIAARESAAREGRLSAAAIERSVENLIPSLRDIRELEIFDDRMQSSMNGWGHITFSALAYDLISHALEVGSAQAVADLERYINEEEYQVHQMLLMKGVRVEQSIELANGIFFGPFYPWEKNNQRHIVGVGERGTEAMDEITAALVKYQMHPRRHEHTEDYDSTKLVGPDVWDYEKLEDALLCLTLIGPSGPAMIATSIAPTNWMPLNSHPIGQLPFPTEARTQVSLGTPELERFQEIHQHFVTLPSHTQNRLRVPMRRLNLAMRRRWNVDSAIDIGVALEVLFTDAKPFDSSIGFTLRLRAARLLRSDQQGREELAQLLANLYKLRSRAAHSGELPKNLSGVDSSEILKRGTIITSEAIKHIIMNGDPDWNAIIYE